MAVASLLPTLGAPEKQTASLQIAMDRPWHWEGHIQSAVERWLRERGWTIKQAMDTTSRQQGIDLKATLGPRRLWVTVKGFPAQTLKTNAPTQARHWFSHAMFDVILYRERDPAVEIAVALPEPFKTYEGLSKRVGWFQRTAAFRFLWVDQGGKVTEGHHRTLPET